jgi:nuclear pore complex protein Nup93
MMEEHLARSARDFDNFLEENVKINWDLQRKRVYEHFGLVQKGSEKSRDESVGSSAGRETGSFGRSRRQARSQSRGGTPSSSRVSNKLGASAISQSVLGSPTKAGQPQGSLFADVEEKSAGIGHIEDRFQKEKQTKFAEKVQSLNQARFRKETYPLIREFAVIEQQASVDQV